MSEEQRIHILPEFIANQIAAGEVVQRPESVVKEVVENSIDAGATHVTVSVRQAGKALLHVLDNGRGMSRADLALALRRHATSKIKTAEDLHRIQTLGFRGEALASIASVASVEIRTRAESDEHGWKLLAEPMKEQSIEPVQQEQGTQIFIRNLFYNIPARRKFLRSDITEFRHISDTMIRFALSYPQTRFTFHDGDSLIFDVKPGSPEQRLRELFGEDVAMSVIPVQYEAQHVSVSGFIGKPNIARTTRASQYFFMNHRAISSKSLAHAVYQGFEHLIDKSQHPFFVLHISLDPEKVDVNVHPQKTEVKFEDERGMYSIVQDATMKALRSANLIPDIRFREQDALSPFEKVQLGAPSGNDVVVVNKITGEIIPHSNTQSGNWSPQRTEQYSRPFSSSGAASQSLSPSTGWNTPFDKTKAWNPDQMSAFDALFNDVQSPNLANQQASAAPPSPEKMMWQMHNKYIFLQTEQGVMIIDQHIAHERILYEKALKAMNESFPFSQKLLFPLTLSLSPTELLLYRELREDLLHLGFEATESGGNVVEIRGIPLDIKAGEEANALREILEQYAEYQTVRPASSRDNLAASFGCRAAIKAGDPLSYPEMRQLIDDLYQCTTPEVCPHGRPVMINFELKEFDRRFGRTS